MRTTERPKQRIGTPPRGSGDYLQRAWAAVALVPLFFLLALAAGEGVMSMLGYPVGGSNPVWVSLLADLAALVVSLAPCVVGVVYGRRARRDRTPGALVPMAIAAGAGVALLVLTIVSEIGNIA